MSLKAIALKLCTCTWIEIMTGIGVTLYLAYLHEYRLATLSACLFSPLIGFHFAIDRLSGKEPNVQWKQNKSQRTYFSGHKTISREQKV